LPKILYRFAISEDNSLNGYLNFSLAWSPPNTTAVPCRLVKGEIYCIKILDLICSISPYSSYMYAPYFHGNAGYILYLRVIMINLRFNEKSVILKYLMLCVNPELLFWALLYITMFNYVYFTQCPLISLCCVFLDTRSLEIGKVILQRSTGIC